MDKPSTHQRRDVRLMTRVTSLEADAIRHNASALKMSISTYLAAMATGQPLAIAPEVPEINKRLYMELSRYNSNLNQMAKHLNSGRISTTDEQALLENMRVMYALIKKAREELCP